ncbi:hypothetical protein [Paracoccus liaowanqingii]|nr:hypothetical protein [Paracoccus liaowanqingii]
MFDIHTEAYLRRTQAVARPAQSDHRLPVAIASGMAPCLALLLALT